MKKREQGKRHRIFAVFLCLCVVFTTQPEIWNRLSVFAAEESDTKVVLSFAELSEEIKEQTVPVGTVYEELELPEELNVFMKHTEISSTPNLAGQKSEEETVSGNDPETGSKEEETDVTEQKEYYAESEEIADYTPENSEKEAQELWETVAGVTWQSDPAYDSNTEETYIFTAILPEGYTLAENVSLPQITVTVKETESGSDFVIQDLLDRIAALPDAEEYLASEPDMDDEDSYAEWEEKLYAYAEEALDIWEEYEELTEEQQTQISEEEMAKLTAWVELAGTIEESSQVMTADDAQHKHCVCGGNINIGDHTTHTEIIVYDNILTSNNGQLLINGTPQLDYTLISGNYYLEGDVALSSELVIAENSTVYICLNNQSISYNRTNGKHRVITVKDNAKLFLCTCGDSGSITGGDADEAGGGISLLASSEFKMYGGSIEDNATTGSGGGMSNGSHVTCNLYKVNICGNKARLGGGIIFTGILNIYGGEIKNNEVVVNGGGIATGSAESCILRDVKICNNTAGDYAGGLYWSNGNLTMSNVEISNNIVSNSTARYQAGGVALMQGTISISGAITISGNQYNGSPNNLCNTYANSRNPGKLFIVGTLDEQSVIGLTNKNVPTEENPDPVEVASGSNHTITAADWSCFFSDDEKYKIIKDGNALFLALPGTCDLSGLDLTAEGAELKPNFQADITTYTATVGNEVDKVGITATLAGSPDGKTIKIKNETVLPETDMTSGVKKEVPLAVGLNTIEITVTSGSETKTYTIEITREAPAGYMVTLNGNGGSAGTNVTSYVSGTEVTLPIDWTKMGYEFAGWYVNDNCTGTEVKEISATDTGDKEYWAKWTPTSYSISYDLDGGTATGNPTSYTIEDSAITLNNPTKEGYTFTGWSGTDLTGSDNMSVTIASGSTGAREYKAHWTAADYKVTLNGNGGKGGTSLISYAHGTGAALPTDWTRAGYSFAGWYDNEGCTGTAVTGILASDTGNKEYWAKWTDNIAPVIGTLQYSYQPKNFWHWLIGKDSLVITVPVTEEGSGADKIAYTVTPDSGTAKVETATIQNGEAKITVSADFKGTISITCTDKAGNISAGVTVGAGVAQNGIIIEDNAPKIAFKAENAELLPSGEYKTAPDIVVTVADDKDNAISAGIASVSYKIGDGSVKTVQHDYTASMVVSDSFTISADEITASGIPADGAVISVTATDNAGNSTTETYTVKVHTHSGTLVSAIDPTCTTAGNKQHYTCSCGKWFSDSGCTNEITDKGIVVLDALGHYFEGQPYQVTTTQHWRKCSRCSVTEQKEDHSFDADNKCTVCGYSKVVDPGHTHSGTLVRATDPTCTLPGNIAYYSCSSCGKLFSDSGCTAEITEQETKIVALGHNFVMQKDQSEHWQQCSRCALEQSRALHIYDNDTDTECNVCGYVRTLQGHTHSGTLVAATEPTCTTAGNKAYYRCSCGKWFSDSSCTKEVTAQDVTIPAKGHTAVTDPAKAASCTETGLSEGSHCSVCGHVIKAQTVTAALGHDYSGNYHYDASGHWKVCSRCGTASAKQRHNYDNDRDTKCNDCDWVRTISDSDDEQDEQPTPTPIPIPEPTEKPSETEQEQQTEGDGEQTVSAAVDNGKIVISGEPVATGNVEGMADTKTVLKLGNGVVIVTVVCAGQEYTAGVADTLAVANAVLTPEQMQLVNNGETIEIRIDVKDISDQVPEQDKETIENGIREYQKEVPGLTLGMYVDISMFIRIGEGDWNAITATREPIEVIIGIPESLQEKGRAYYIIRAHDGIPAFMNDMDDEPGTITVSTDLFSSYAIAYVQADGTGHKCGLCHICPTFLGICYFIWLAIIIFIIIVVLIILHKRQKQEQQEENNV